MISPEFSRTLILCLGGRKKKQDEKCCVSNCFEKSFTCMRNTPITSLEIDTENSETFPLCKHHYFLIKNKELNLQTTCPTCNISLHNKTTRACPDAKRVQKYFENTGYNIEISTDSKVCKNESVFSTDTDLQGIISDLTTSMKARSTASTIDESFNLKALAFVWDSPRHLYTSLQLPDN